MLPFCGCVCQDYRQWLIISNNNNNNNCDAVLDHAATRHQVMAKDQFAEKLVKIVFPKTELDAEFVIPDVTILANQIPNNNNLYMSDDTLMNFSQTTDSSIDPHPIIIRDDESKSLISVDDIRLLNQVNHAVDKRRLLKIQKSKKYNKRRQSINYYQSIRICNPDRFGLVDLSNGNLTQKYLNKYITSWDFNIFRLNRFTGGKSTLIELGMEIFKSHNLLSCFRFDRDSVKKFLYSVQSVYHSFNPYHNALHSADVAQSMHCFLSDDNIKVISNPIEILGCIIAALCHDADHPGLNQLYLEKINHFFVSLYNYSSVLENHHIRVTMSLLHQSTLLNFLSADEWRTIVPIICNLILATDITHQKSYLNKFINFNQEKKRYPRSSIRYSAENKLLIYQMALKCSDISNPCRCWPVSLGWASLVCEEFFLQGDTEKILGLSVLSTHDRCMTTKADIQLGFIRFIVRPLIIQWHGFLSSRLSTTLVRQVELNLNSWESFKQRFGAVSSKTLQNPIMKVENNMPLNSGLATLTEETTLTSACITRHHTERRLSLPDSVIKQPVKKGTHHSSTTMVTFPRPMVPSACRRGSLPQHPRSTSSTKADSGRRRGSLPLNVRAFPVPSAWEDGGARAAHAPAMQGRRGSAPLIGSPSHSQDYAGPGASGLLRGCSREQMLLEVYLMSASSSIESSINSLRGASNTNLALLSSVHQSSSSSSSPGGYVAIR